MDHIGLITILIPAILFLIFLWFLITPILRDKSVIAPATNGRSKGIEKEDRVHSIEDRHEKATTLLNWMRRSSRGRFADTEGNHNAPNLNVSHLAQRKSEPDAHRRQFSLSALFARNSLVPHIVSVTPSPPPVYTPTIPIFAPAISSPLSRPPLDCMPPRQEPGLLTVPRIIVPARRISLRSISGPAMPSTMSTIRPHIPLRSLSDSENTLACLPSPLSVPSRALVLDHESSGSIASMRIPVVQTRSDAGFPVGNIAKSTFSDRDSRGLGLGLPF